jgi:hypothetical protein
MAYPNYNNGLLERELFELVWTCDDEMKSISLEE